MTELRALLAGGDRRSIGRVPEVVAAVQATPALLAELVAAMADADPVVRMRAADAVEKGQCPEKPPAGDILPTL